MWCSYWCAHPHADAHIGKKICTLKYHIDCGMIKRINGFTLSSKWRTYWELCVYCWSTIQRTQLPVCSPLAAPTVHTVPCMLSTCCSNSTHSTLYVLHLTLHIIQLYALIGWVTFLWYKHNKFLKYYDVIKYHICKYNMMKQNILYSTVVVCNHILSMSYKIITDHCCKRIMQ